MLFANNTAQRDEDEMREAFERLARDAGYSGNFSVFDLDEPELDSSQADVTLAMRASDPTRWSEPSAETPAPQARDHAAPAAPTSDGEGSGVDYAQALGNEIDSLVSRDTHFRNAVVGGFDKSSVWQYVDEVDAAFAGMQTNYEKQFKDLSAECARITAECSLVHEQMDEAERRCRESEAELSQKCEQLDATLQERNRLIDDLAQELEAKERIINEQDAALSKESELESQLDAMEESIGRLTKERDEKEVLLASMKSAIDEMNAEMEANAETRERLLAEIEAAKASAAEEGLRAAAAEARCNDFEEALAAGELKLKELESVKKSLSETLSETVAAVDGMRGRVESLMAEKSALLAKVDEQDKANAQAQDSIVRLNDRLAGALEDNRVVSQQLDVERKRGGELAQEVESLKALLDEARQESASLRGAVADLTAQRDEVFAKLSEANRSMEALLGDNRRLMAELDGFVARRSKIAAVLGISEDVSR